MLYLLLEFYHSERLQIRTSQRNRYIEQTGERWGLEREVSIFLGICHPPSIDVWQYAWNAVNSRNLSEPLVFRALLGFDHILPVWLTCSLHLLWRSELMQPIQSHH